MRQRTSIYVYYYVLMLIIAAALPEKGHAQKPLIYTVKGGDTLGEIARRYQVSVGQLRLWNGLADDKIIRGQQLTLWPHGGPRWYVVRSGETLSEIALQFDVSITQLLFSSFYKWKHPISIFQYHLELFLLVYF